VFADLLAPRSFGRHEGTNARRERLGPKGERCTRRSFLRTARVQISATRFRLLCLPPPIKVVARKYQMI
jgi:hypothetical protein